MLFFSLFLAGFTLGVFAALKIFAPETQEELWDSQNFPNQNYDKLNSRKITTPLVSRQNMVHKHISSTVIYNKVK